MEDIFQSSVKKKTAEKFTYSKTFFKKKFNYNGFNLDISQAYYWHLNFRYITLKGFTSIKLEDYHYFSESSNFGSSQRQARGGAARSFQENLNQLVQLIKVHLIPLLKEVKQTEFYKDWIEKISDNDEIVQKLLEKKVASGNLELKKARDERNEAILHIKDKWVTEVDQGKIWQMQNVSKERGLDYALLPQLFFGINLDDPFFKKRSIKEQLDEDVYPVDISYDAKQQVARFLYRFHSWLPTAVKETKITFNIKIASLKQFYTQLQMSIQLIKPLLKEIVKKNEGFQSSSLFHNYDFENPNIVSFFESSYSFAKVLFVKGFEGKKHKIDSLEFTKRGFYIGNPKEIIAGQFKGKKGFVISEGEVVYLENSKKEVQSYEFVPCENKNVSDEEFNEALKYKGDLIKVHLSSYSCFSIDFSQKRQTFLRGENPTPYMINEIIYESFVWNLVEIASFREKLKVYDLDLLDSFIDEISSIKEDLLYYINNLYQNKESLKEDKKKEPKKEVFNKKFLNKNFWKENEKQAEFNFTINKLDSIETTWKCYKVFKISFGYSTY